MNGWRIAQIIIVLIIASPFLYLQYWGYKASKYTFDMQSQNEAYLAGEIEADEIEHGQIPEVPWAGLTKRFDRQKSTSETGLNNNRVVSVSEIVQIDDLLAQGETLPAPVYEELFAMARAPGYLIDRCDDVLATIGTRCIVLRSSASVVDRPTQDLHHIAINARLAYAPNYAIGTTDIVGGDFVSFRVDLNGDEEPVNYPVPNAETRRGYLQTALQICDTLREEHGSCVIEDLTLKHTRLSDRHMKDQPEGASRIRLESRVRLGVFGIDTRENRKAFEARAKEILAALN